MIKTELNYLGMQPKSFIRTSCKGGKGERDAKKNCYRNSSDMRYLHGVNTWRNLRAERCDTTTGFDVEQLSKGVCTGGGDCDW